jgi:hypothetical protein
MASRVSSRRWLLRDLPRTYVLLALVVPVLAILSYFIDWSAIRHENSVQPQSDNPNKNKDELRYAGWIIVPTRRDQCWQFMLDNRTGNMRDGGFVKCDEAARQFAEKNPPAGSDLIRLREVGKAFHHKDN